MKILEAADTVLVFAKTVVSAAKVLAAERNATHVFKKGSIGVSAKSTIRVGMNCCRMNMHNYHSTDLREKSRSPVTVRSASSIRTK
jgi:hypothetical protein